MRPSKWHTLRAWQENQFDIDEMKSISLDQSPPPFLTLGALVRFVVVVLSPHCYTRFISTELNVENVVKLSNNEKQNLWEDWHLWASERERENNSRTDKRGDRLRWLEALELSVYTLFFSHRLIRQHKKKSYQFSSVQASDVSSRILIFESCVSILISRSSIFYFKFVSLCERENPPFKRFPSLYRDEKKIIFERNKKRER